MCPPFFLMIYLEFSDIISIFVVENEDDMEVVDKKGLLIQTGFATVSHKKFLDEILPPFEKIRVGVGGGKEPFAYTYFEVAKEEVIEIVRTNQSKVTFSIMFNSLVREELPDVLYIKKLKMTIV